MIKLISQISFVKICKQVFEAFALFQDVAHVPTAFVNTLLFAVLALPHSTDTQVLNVGLREALIRNWFCFTVRRGRVEI